MIIFMHLVVITCEAFETVAHHPISNIDSHRVAS